mgnify:CR=1 FL=1
MKHKKIMDLEQNCNKNSQKSAHLDLFKISEKSRNYVLKKFVIMVSFCVTSRDFYKFLY